MSTMYYYENSVLLMQAAIDNVRKNPTSVIIGDLEIRNNNKPIFSASNIPLFIQTGSSSYSGIQELNDCNISEATVMVVPFKGYFLAELLNPLSFFSKGKSFQEIRIKEKIKNDGQETTAKERVFSGSVQITAIEHTDDFIAFCIECETIADANIIAGERKTGTQALVNKTLNDATRSTLPANNNNSVSEEELKHYIMESCLARAGQLDRAGSEGNFYLTIKTKKKDLKCKKSIGFEYRVLSKYGYAGDFEIDKMAPAVLIFNKEENINEIRGMYSRGSVYDFRLEGKIKINGEYQTVCLIDLDNSQIIKSYDRNNGAYHCVMFKPTKITLQTKKIDETSKKLTGNLSCIFRDSSIFGPTNSK